MKSPDFAPLVSVVMPAYNAASTVGRAVASIRAQTLLNWELLAVDDGSTDDTRAILDHLAIHDPRIRVLARPHEGVVAASNAGIAVARAEYVARMDADDESHPERLAGQLDFFHAAANRAVGVVSSLVEFGGNRLASAGYALHVDWINGLVTEEQMALNRFVELPFAHSSVMFRRALVEKFGAYRAGDFPEDYEWWLRWMDAGVRTAKVARVLLRWNDPAGRLSRTDARYDPEAFFRVKAAYIARWLSAESGSASREILVWGAGRPTRKRAAHLQPHGVRIAGYIDVDAKKVGRGVGGTGLPVIAPDALPPPGRVFVLGYVSTRGAREWNRRELHARGYVEGRDFLMCA